MKRYKAIGGALKLAMFTVSMATKLGLVAFTAERNMTRLGLFAIAGVIALIVTDIFVGTIFWACVQMFSVATQMRFLPVNMEAILVSIAFLVIGTFAPALALIILSWTFIWEDKKNYIYFGAIAGTIGALIFILNIPGDLDVAPEQISLLDPFGSVVAYILIALSSSAGMLWAFVFWFVLKRFLPRMYE